MTLLTGRSWLRPRSPTLGHRQAARSGSRCREGPLTAAFARRSASYAAGVVTNRGRWVVTVVVGLVVIAPALLADPGDDFPISTYPMFTAERDRVVDIDTAVLVDADGRRRLSPEIVGGTEEIVSAAVTVSRAIADGDVSLARLCAEIAGRVDGPGSVEIVTERHDAVALLQDGVPPVAVTVHERCEAP